jgi:hypothetical protein
MKELIEEKSFSRPWPKRIVQTRSHAKIAKLLKTHTLQEVGDMYGVSRERIRQIALTQGVKTPRKSFKVICAICGRMETRHKPINSITCSLCRAYTKYHQENNTAQTHLRKHQVKKICIRCHKHPTREHNLCNACDANDYYHKHKNQPKYKEQMRIARQKYYLKNKEWLSEYHHQRFIKMHLVIDK